MIDPLSTIQKAIATGLLVLALTSACGPALPPRLDRPLTALEQCRLSVIEKRRECAPCFVWLVGAPFCYLACGLSADALERQCNAYAFEAERTLRMQPDATVHEGAPR